jgi:hypothetical protein
MVRLDGYEPSSAASISTVRLAFRLGGRWKFYEVSAASEHHSTPLRWMHRITLLAGAAGRRDMEA